MITPEGIAHCIRRLGECPDLESLERVWNEPAFAYQREPSVQAAKNSMKEVLV